ncbi:hypothetical protein DFJ73DRAFT_873439 [Zopfochytrium polystomum]|nr:hypothetical protein DFJ73DRAFT_873439 [Zopfochytrium polystomum]
MSARCQDAIILLNETLQAPSAPDDPLVDAESIQDALALCLQTVSNSIIIAFAAAEALMGRESSGSVHRMEVASRLERARTACATLKPQADQLARMATGPSPVIRAVEAQREEVLHNVSVVDAELGLLWARLLGRMEEIQVLDSCFSFFFLLFFLLLLFSSHTASACGYLARWVH